VYRSSVTKPSQAAARFSRSAISSASNLGLF
jgi:hypothetical protein